MINQSEASPRCATALPRGDFPSIEFSISECTTPRRKEAWHATSKVAFAVPFFPPDHIPQDYDVATRMRGKSTVLFRERPTERIRKAQAVSLNSAYIPAFILRSGSQLGAARTECSDKATQRCVRCADCVCIQSLPVIGGFAIQARGSLQSPAQTCCTQTSAGHELANSFGR